jgi:hypothetical protein
MDRTTIVAGPAIVIYEGVTFYTKDDIEAKPTIERFQIDTSMFGAADERLDTVVWEINFTPVGANLTTGEVSVALWPHQKPIIGSSMFGATDRNLVIHSLAGEHLTFKACCVTSMPDIILSTTQTAVGSVTFHAIGANDTEMSDSAKYAEIAATAFSDTSFDPSAVKTIPYTAKFGSFTDLQTQEGWTISTDMAYEPIKVDNYGIVDYRLTSVGVMAKCKPVGISVSEVLGLLNVQGSGVRRGMSLRDNAEYLDIYGATSGDLGVNIPLAHVVEAGYRFGNGSTLRNDELGFVAIQKFNSGSQEFLFSLYEYLTD